MRETRLNYRQTLAQMAKQIGRARKPGGWIDSYESKRKEANLFCERFGFTSRFEPLPNLEELKELAKLDQQKEKRKAAAREKKLLRESQETISKWLAGERVSIPYHIRDVYLRANGDEMETSKGARVPLDSARLAYRFAVSKRECGWHRNGEQCPIGQFQIDEIRSDYVIAGCHKVSWDEIDRFAKANGWTSK